jgi:hypothetical protein
MDMDQSTNEAEQREAGLSHALRQARDRAGSDEVVALQAELVAVRDALAGAYAEQPHRRPNLQRAEQIATEVHAGQVDKAGAPSIDHPRRVAGHTDGSPDAVAAAWLHDVLEDGPFNDTEFRYGMAVLAQQALGETPAEPSREQV